MSLLFSQSESYLDIFAELKKKTIIHCIEFKLNKKLLKEKKAYEFHMRKIYGKTDKKKSEKLHEESTNTSTPTNQFARKCEVFRVYIALAPFDLFYSIPYFFFVPILILLDS